MYVCLYIMYIYRCTCMFSFIYMYGSITTGQRAPSPISPCPNRMGLRVPTAGVAAAAAGLGSKPELHGRAIFGSPKGHKNTGHGFDIGIFVGAVRYSPYRTLSPCHMAQLSLLLTVASYKHKDAANHGFWNPSCLGP